MSDTRFALWLVVAAINAYCCGLAIGAVLAL